MVKRLLRVAGAPSELFGVMNAYTLGTYSKNWGVTREGALVAFYNAYRMLQKTDYLVNDYGEDSIAYTIFYNVNSKKALTGTDNEAYQEAFGYDCQKLSFQYNNDGTVSIINGNGWYLDIKDGAATSGGELIWAKKSGSSSQKFVFTVVEWRK